MGLDAQIISQWIGECVICQKIKYRPNEVVHHLYRLTPLASLSVDALGPLKQNENGNSFIIAIICNFSKLCGIWPRTRLSVVHTMGLNFRGTKRYQGRRWISVYVQDSSGPSLLRFQHLIVVAYHPQANGIVKRRINYIHLRALVYEKIEFAMFGANIFPWCSEF